MKRQKFTEVDMGFIANCSPIERVFHKDPEYAKYLAEDIDNWISHFVGDEIISDKPTRDLIAAIEAFAEGKTTLRELEIQSDKAKNFLNN
jgi:hypothetical protein